MISSGNQNQFPSSFAPLRDLLKALMFLSNLNNFNSSPSPLDQRFAQTKGSSKVWKKKCSKRFSHFFSLSPPPPLFFWFMHYLCGLLSCFWVNLVLWYALFNMFFICLFSVLFYFVFHKNLKKKLKKKIQKQCVLDLWMLCIVFVERCFFWEIIMLIGSMFE